MNDIVISERPVFVPDELYGLPNIPQIPGFLLFLPAVGPPEVGSSGPDTQDLK